VKVDPVSAIDQDSAKEDQDVLEDRREEEVDVVKAARAAKEVAVVAREDVGVMGVDVDVVAKARKGNLLTGNPPPNSAVS
jgi:methylthioribose-1-phosphate isomerase